MDAPDFLGYRGARAIVTGSSSGIGRCVAIRLAQHGASVMLVGRREESLRETAALAAEVALGDAVCQCVVADLADESAAKTIVEEAVAKMGGIDLLVNAAAKLHRETADGEVTDQATWDAVMRTNLRAPYLLSKFSAPHLAAQEGAIVNISSIWAHIGARKQVAYSTSKAAMVELTRSMALDFSPDRIRVNCVCPSTTRTSLIFQGRSSFNESAVAAAHPLGKIGEPEDIANAVLFLGSKKAAGWITGAELTVDGGYTIQ